MESFSWISLLPVSIAFVGGSLVAAAATWARVWWLRPIIRVTFSSIGGCSVSTQNREGQPLHFIRAKVENAGRSTVVGCAGYVTGIRRTLPNHHAVDLAHEVIDMRWAHKGASARDIPVGAFFFLDLAFLNVGSHSLDACWDVPHSFVVQTRDDPIFGVAQKAKYRFDLLVAADNAQPAKGPVTFEYDPGARVLAFEANQSFRGR